MLVTLPCPCAKGDEPGAIENGSGYETVTYTTCPACEGSATIDVDVTGDDKTWLALSNMPYMTKFAVARWMMEVTTDIKYPSDNQVEDFMETAVYICSPKHAELCDKVLARLEELPSDYQYSLAEVLVHAD